jgi:hypothetical protein
MIDMRTCHFVNLAVIALVTFTYAGWSPSGRHRTDDDTSSLGARTPSFYQTASDIDPMTLTSTLVVAQADNGSSMNDMKIFVDRNLIGTSSTNSLTYTDIPPGSHYIIFSFGDNFFIDKYSLRGDDSCYISAGRAPAGESATFKFTKISNDSGISLEASGAYAVRYAKYANGNILMNQKYFDNLVDQFERGTKFVGDTKGAPSPTQFKFGPRKSGSDK